jgi:hypothetical protein
MRDVLFPLIVIAFFALATVLVKACDRLLEAAREPERNGGGQPEPR